MFSPSPHPASRRTRNIPSSSSRRRFPSGSHLNGSGLGRAASSRISVESDASLPADAASEMDVDYAGPSHQESKMRSANLFAQSDELSVSLVAHLPAEVLQVLRNTDFVRDRFTGDVDTQNTYCLITSIKTCFVWKYAQLITGTPTCYIFPCPNRYSEVDVPFCALVSFGPSREPGLILLSPYGETLFWDSIGLGLTGGEASDDSVLSLSSDESVTSLIYAKAQTFIATTSRGRLFLLDVTSTDGRFRIAAHTFTLAKPLTGLERLRQGLWGENAPLYTGDWITAATVTDMNGEGFEVWTCMEQRIVRWSVLHKGWEQFEKVQDISSTLREVLSVEFPTINADSNIDLELLDVAFDVENHLIILISFNAGLEDDSALDRRPRRNYVIARMKREDELTVESIRSVPYQTIPSDKANIHPRLRLMNGGLLYCVQFGDAVAIVAKDTNYNSFLTLKSLQDRTFGCGVVDGSPEILFMNSDVLMRVVVDIEKINSFNENTWRGTSIKSIMMQAIMYGSNPKNPLLFTFPPDVEEESLISGAEQLSRAVLSSDVEVVRPNPDLTQQIMERKDRLRFLIGFINENGALGKMSQTSRQRLATDAEKLHAAQQLWTLYCQHVNSGVDENLLLRAVEAYMQNLDEARHEDIMRAFFRLQTREIGNLLPYIRHEVGEVLRNYNLKESEPDALCRAVDHLLCILQSAWSYRETNSGVYGIVEPMLNPWTSSVLVVDIVLEFFNLANKLLTDAEPDAENAIVRETRGQLPRLASTVFHCFQERQEWLESPFAAGEPGNESEKRTFRERFLQVRPQVLHALFKHDKSKHAFKLAEEYHDFRSLADLCHSTPPIYPNSSNVNAERIRRYIEQYREEFTDELYQWYIENSELRCMFAESDVYGDYIDAFFAKHPQPSISWVHDLGKGRWGSASSTLLTQVDRTSNLETRHVLLSIGKLAQIAEAEKFAASADTALDAFHDGLDYISVHQELIDELRESLVGSKARLSLDNQVDIIIKAVAPSLKAKTFPGFHAEFRTCMKMLLQNHALGVEDLVDVITLKESTLDFGNALELIKSVKGMPEARQLSAFRTVWRRIYIRDDWGSISKTANKTDSQLVDKFRKTALYAAVKDALRRARKEQNIGPAAKQFDIPNIVLPLEEAAKLPARAELSSRWPGHADEQLEALEQDYESERLRLESVELGPIVERVKELAAEELEDDLEMDDVAMGMEV